MVAPLILYRTEIRHQRRHPISHQFSYPSYWWLIDIDQLDAIPLALRSVIRPRSRDYCGDPHASIAANVHAFLSAADIDTTDLTIQMLTTPRQFGYTFNPITVFYCTRRPGGAFAAVIAEVHNTYGDRHRYLLHPDARDESEVPKEMSVSPFFDLSGHYRIHSPAPDSALRLTVRLHRDGEPPFIASAIGKQVPITLKTVAASLTLGTALLTSARIRYQGITLWRKRLAIHPRRQFQGARHG